MKVEFKNGFRIESDSLQFVVTQRKVVQAGAKTKKENVGNIVYTHVAYCPTLEFALKSIGRQLCLEIDELQDIKIALNSLEREIAAMTKELQVEVKFDAEN